MAIDWEFIAEREGGNLLDGYVPAPSSSRSGVTVGKGFDIGQRNERDLQVLGLSDALVKKLAPYCRLKGFDAVAALRARPLRITEAEANAINRAVKAKTVRDLKAKYDQDSKVRFDDIPDEAQTVIASVEFQYGSIRAKRRKFWDIVTAQDWKGAVAKLLRFGDDYPTRRKIEAKYLDKLVKRQEAAKKAMEAAKQAEASSSPP